MYIRRVSIESTDPTASARKTLYGWMITTRGAVLILVTAALIHGMAAAYLYSRFKEKSRLVDIWKESHRKQTELVRDVLEKHDRLLKKLPPLIENTQRLPADVFIRTYGTAAERHIDLITAFEQTDYTESLKKANLLLAMEGLDSNIRRDALLKKGWALFYLGDPALAETVAREGLQDFPQFQPLEFLLGKSLLLQEKWGEAQPIIENLVKLQASPDRLFARGNLYNGLGKHEHAVADFRQVLQYGNPFQERAAANNLALLLAEKIGDMAGAEIYVTVLMGLAPTSFRTFLTVGRVSMLQGNLERAEVFLERAYQKQDKNVEAVLNLAILRQIQGKKNESKKLLEQAQLLDPDYQSLFNLIHESVVKQR